MSAFYYESIDGRGLAKQGVHKAELVRDVEKWLQSQHLTPVRIMATEELAGASAPAERKISLLQKWQGITINDHILF
jgi:type II secretory pathway component PulF